MLSRILIVLAVLLGLLVVVSFFLPTNHVIAHEIEIAAKPAQIHQEVVDLRDWPDWTVWNNTTDPECEWSFEGEPGVGAVMSWDGPKLGKGSLTVTEANPQTGMHYTVALEGMEPVQGVVSYEPTGSGTKVRWSDAVEFPGFLDRWIAYAVVPMLSAEFERNLTSLKKRVEGGGAGTETPSNDDGKDGNGAPEGEPKSGR
jgi:hypothetical protein